MKSHLTFSVGWVGGWLEIWRVKLISTQVLGLVEVGVELGNSIGRLHCSIYIPLSKLNTLDLNLVQTPDDETRKRKCAVQVYFRF